MELLEPEAFAALTEPDCIRIQQALAAQVEERDCLSAVRTVAGVDLAYWQEEAREAAVCCIVVLDAETRAVVEEQFCAGEVRFPYIPGCFAFRELPLLLRAAERLTVRPDVFLFDGNGILHPRGLGLASHASFYLDAPTAGVAKRYFQLDGASCGPLEDRAGAWADITREGRVLGRALRTRAGTKPVYISVGNRICLETAAELALRLTGPESRIPMPTRLADLATHRRRNEIRASGGARRWL